MKVKVNLNVLYFEADCYCCLLYPLFMPFLVCLGTWHLGLLRQLLVIYLLVINNIDGQLR
jgi:hypothetical protein